jgi:tRNA A-37 threonylcarbamoyl transferase component Bud32
MRFAGTGATPDTSGTAALDEPLGPYRLTGVLGHGGMALVYRARDAQGREVALKVIQESPFLPGGMLERFRREAEAAKRLAGHPHIVPILDTGQVGRNHYIAMQLVPGGRTLVNLLREAPLPVSTAIELALKVAGALDFAHREGIIHRDVKPANVLLTPEGEPLLADFGLARIEMGLGVDLTVTSMALGTPRYMAPEQAASLKSASHLSDMYSLGVVLYEMLTGKPPYEITTDHGMEQVIRIIRERIPPPPRRLRPGLSRSLEAVVMKMLEKEPARRYASMAEVIADLNACLNRSRVRASPFSLGRRADMFLLGHRRTVVGLMLAATALTAGVLWHRSALRAAQHRQVFPQAEAASRALELERMRSRLAGEAEEEEVPPGLREAETALLSAGGAERACAALDALLAKVADPAERRDLERSRGWALVAAGQTVPARAALQTLREEYARRREILRVRNGDPRIRDAKYAMACLDEALAAELAGERDAALALWQRSREELPPQAPQAELCAGALGERSPEDLATWAAAQRPSVAALGFLLAALRASAGASSAIWRAEARRLANPAVPWLYYYLTFGPGAGPQPAAVPTPETPP